MPRRTLVSLLCVYALFLLGRRWPTGRCALPPAWRKNNDRQWWWDIMVEDLLCVCVALVISYFCEHDNLARHSFQRDYQVNNLFSVERTICASFTIWLGKRMPFCCTTFIVVDCCRWEVIFFVMPAAVVLDLFYCCVFFLSYLPISSTQKSLSNQPTPQFSSADWGYLPVWAWWCAGWLAGVLLCVLLLFQLWQVGWTEGGGTLLHLPHHPMRCPVMLPPATPSLFPIYFPQP